MIIPGQPAPANATANTSAALDLAALRPGQVVNAQVVGSTPGGATRLALGTQIVEAQLAQVPPTGTVAQLRVEGTAQNLRLVLTGLITPQTAANSSTGTPAAAVVAQAMQSAIGRQDSAGPLLTTLQGVTGNNTTLPEPVTAAARLLLASRLDLAPEQQGTARLGGPELANAVLRSGVFFEAMLLAGNPAGAPQGDFKAILLLMRAVLTGWLGGEATKPASGARPPPPAKGTAPRAPVLPGGQADPPAAVGPALLARTEATLARIRLAQFASLPEAGPGKDGARPGTSAEWTIEIPVFLGSQTTMLPLTITREGKSGGVAERNDWRIQFAVQFAGLGEVGGQVTWRGGTVAINLWADRKTTRDKLRQTLDELAQMLDAQGIEVGMIRCQARPPAARAAPTGQFIDARS